ncbi:transporter substrate-binding domain-containing protein [Kordiimonas lacus]|uniref:Extracellular solute-binding protein, family 3 n=1 Tax=Kordiimonas lacus TaxID=637679 RepID=A0A1G7E7A0_9PROT|nr:transporter substrate-binding domain-containing protein [Kordiimonas lacus]SDE59356.1 extracellular solute-binding protein, family 3 [Kordiimonas lacus]
MRIIIGSACLGLFISGACAADPLRIFGTELRGVFEPNGTGPYHEAFELLTDGYDQPVELKMAPLKRAENQFVQRGSDCLFAGSAVAGYYEPFGLSGKQLLVSDPIFTFKMKLYGPKGADPIEEFESLKGKMIAIDTGVGNVPFIAEQMGHPADLVLPSRTLQQGFQLLDIGRVAALVAVDLDVRFLQAREPGYLGYPVSRDMSVLESKDVVVCHKGPQTEAFIAHINRSARALNCGRTLEALLDRYLVGLTPQ